MPTGIYKRTESHKKRLSESHKGKKRPPRSKDWGKKISKALTGRKRKPFSEKHRRNIAKTHKGAKSNFWKGGITPKHLVIRASIEHRLWRESVFARDNWTCQKYGTRGRELHPHHIKNFAEYPELRFAIDNGITLSKKAHDGFHKIYGKKNNTKEQLEKFLGKML